jgi:hypothetical protein
MGQQDHTFVEISFKKSLKKSENTPKIYKFQNFEYTVNFWTPTNVSLQM